MEKFWKKAIALMMTVFLILPFIYTTSVEAEQPANGRITANELYMREGPGTEYNRIMLYDDVPLILTRGQKVNVFGESNGWYAISVEYNGNLLVGYALGDYIETDYKPDNGRNGDGDDGISDKSAYVNANELYMREGPGTNYSNIFLNGEKVTLLRNQKVTVLGEFDGWYLLSAFFDGVNVTGYSLGRYITLGEGEVPVAEPTPTEIPVVTAAPTPTESPVITDTPEPTGDVTPVTTPGADENGFKEPVEYEGHTIAEYLPVDLKNKKVPQKYSVETVSYTTKLDLNASVSVDGLEIRKTATMASSVIAKLPADTKVIVCSTSSGTATVNGKSVSMRWYRILTVIDEEPVRGYCLSNGVELDSEAFVTTRYAKQVLRSKPSSTADPVKTSKNKKVKLAKGTQVKVIGEVQKNETTKWFMVEATFKNENLVGYIPANRLTFVTGSEKLSLRYPVLKEEYKVTPTPEITADPGITDVPTGSPDISGIPTGDTEVSPYPTGNPDAPTAEPTPTPVIIFDSLPDADAVIVNAPSLSVKTEPKYSSNALFSIDDKVIMLYTGQPVRILSTLSDSGINWCEINLLFEGVIYSGYVNASYVVPNDGCALFTGDGSDSASDVDFETKLTLQGFPESYKPYLRKLHEKYPNWEFEAFLTGLDWNETIKAETEIGVNLIPNTKSIEWKSLEPGAYSWKNDKCTVFDGSTWVTASKAATEYYMDPRNFLEEDTIFQFEKLTYNPNYQTKSGIDTILKNTAMKDTGYDYTDYSGNKCHISYTDTFAMAAEYSGVSPLHLASRVKQEVSMGANAMSNSVSGKVSGYEGLYNFYNIGAYNSTVSGGAIANGLKYARDGSNSASLNLRCLFPWTNRFRSILGGAFYIGNNYINRGQDTIYLQKFNVTSNNTYNHQYMGNIEAPYSEGKRLLAAYENPAELAVVFSIPVYENMPKKACPVPEKQYNPNNWLSSLKLYDGSGSKLSLTPSFNVSYTGEYSLIVDNSVDYIKINAATVSVKASVTSTNYFYPEVGDNRLVVSVKAENGDIREYIVNVVREAAPTPEPTPEITPEPTPEVAPEPTPEVTPEPTPEVTPEVTPDPTGDVTPGPTGDVTPGPTGDVTPSPTGDVTPGPTGDATPSPTGDATPSPTGDVTPSPTGDVTPSPTGDVTPSPTGDVTPSPTPDVTPDSAGT